MNVKNVERTENSTAKLAVEVDREQFSAALDAAYRKNRKNITVPGFRKGKAPRKIIEGMYGTSVFYEDAVNEIFPSVFDEAVKAGELSPVGSPSIADLNVAEDGTLNLTIETAVYPEVTLGEYKGLEVEKREVAVEEKEIDDEIERLSQRNARIETVERPIQNGDTAIIDFEGFQDGVAFDGGKGENYSLKIGSGSFIPGFEDALIGAKAGDETEVNVTFPDDYGAENLAGKPAVFKCKIHEVKEEIRPEIDDEFAKDVSEYDTLAELRKSIEDKLRADRQTSIDNEFENKAVEAAAANMTAVIPACMVDEQVDKLLEQYSYQMQMNGISMDQYMKMMGMDAAGMRASLRPSAEKQVRSELLLRKLAELEDLDVTQEEIDAEYQRLVEEYDMELEKVKGYISEEDMKGDLKVQKAAKIVSESAVPVAPKPAEKPEAADEKKDGE